MPIDRGLIDQQLEALGEGSRWWEVRELRDLPAVLHAEERILAIARGKIARIRWLRRPWLILVTNRRLLCMRSGAGSSWKQLEVPAGHITRVGYHLGPFRGRVLVVAGSRKYRLLIRRTEAQKLVSALALLNPPGNQGRDGFAPTRMVRQMVDHLLALPAVVLEDEPGPAGLPGLVESSPLWQRVESLEAQVQELQQQVDFLEQLLRERHESQPAAGHR